MTRVLLRWEVLVSLACPLCLAMILYFMHCTLEIGSVVVVVVEMRIMSMVVEFSSVSQ